MSSDGEKEAGEMSTQESQAPPVNDGHEAPVRTTEEDENDGSEASEDVDWPSVWLYVRSQSTLVHRETPPADNTFTDDDGYEVSRGSAPPYLELCDTVNPGPADNSATSEIGTPWTDTMGINARVDIQTPGNENPPDNALPEPDSSIRRMVEPHIIVEPADSVREGSEEGEYEEIPEYHYVDQGLMMRLRQPSLPARDIKHSTGPGQARNMRLLIVSVVSVVSVLVLAAIVVPVAIALSSLNKGEFYFLHLFIFSLLPAQVLQ